MGWDLRIIPRPPGARCTENYLTSLAPRPYFHQTSVISLYYTIILQLASTIIDSWREVDSTAVLFSPNTLTTPTPSHETPRTPRECIGRYLIPRNVFACESRIWDVKRQYLPGGRDDLWNDRQNEGESRVVVWRFGGGWWGGGGEVIGGITWSSLSLRKETFHPICFIQL